MTSSNNIVSGDLSGGESFSQIGGDSAFATQDLKQMQSVLDAVNTSASRAAQTLTKTFMGASTSARGFQGVLSAIAGSLSQSLAKGAGDVVKSGFSSIIGSLFSNDASPSVETFADGGIVAQPTFFGNSGAAGLMGERGAEAVMPLARGPNGQLGVVSNSAQKSPAINVTIQTQDAESFRKSQSQVSAALARAVARGQRSL